MCSCAKLPGTKLPDRGREPLAGVHALRYSEVKPDVRSISGEPLTITRCRRTGRLSIG